MKIESLVKKLSKAIMDCDEKAARKIAEETIEAKIDLVAVIRNGITEPMKILGEKFRNFEIFLPDVMLAADAAKEAITILKPHIPREEKTDLGKVVIGTVFGDIHDIGKNIVGTMLGVAGFEVYDIGCDVLVEKFVEKAEEVEADFIAMSCLLTPSMFFQCDVIELLSAKGVREKYWVLVGGGPVTPEWTRKIGADGYGRHADDGVEVAKILIKGTAVDLPIIKGLRS